MHYLFHIYNADYCSAAINGADADFDEGFVRKQWLSKQMRNRFNDTKLTSVNPFYVFFSSFFLSFRIAQFTHPVPVKIFCGSFNLHAKYKLADDSGLNKWLCPSGTADADIYAISFQEIVELNPVNVTVDIKSSHVAHIWEDSILHCLNSHCRDGERFVHVVSKQLVGALICLFIREPLRPHVHDVRAASTACGVMGVMGNKGGVVVRFKLYRR